MKVLPTASVALTLALFAGAAAAQQATVASGDTIRLDGTVYEFYGIDSAEIKQRCADGWPAGRAAVRYLRELVHDKTVICETKDTERDGRQLAICRADGVDLSAAMVSAGHALAFVRDSHDYIGEEAQANLDRLGVHAHDCDAPWEWRAARRAERKVGR